MTYALFIIHIVLSTWTVLVMRSAIVSLHNAGKSKEELENIKTGYSALQRFMLLNVKDSSAGMPKYNIYRKNIEKFLKIYLIVSLVIWVLLILAIVVEGMQTFVAVIIIGKAVIVDIGVVFAYIKFNTVLDKKRKMLCWKWEAKQKK